MHLKPFLFFIVLASIISCSSVQVFDFQDKSALEKRLKERINGYQTSFLNNDPEKMWDFMRSKNDQDKNFSETYINNFKENNHMSFYFKTEYRIKNINIKGTKAKAWIAYSIQEKQGSNLMDAEVVDYWEFRDNDWFLKDSGNIEFFKNINW